MNKTILAIDTATEACSVALQHNGKLTSLDELSPRTHTQRILPMIDELLAQANISIKQVDALVFGRGPGSFTGVRVGVGIAQGLAMGANIPVVPISNLLAMAQAAYEQTGATNVVVLIDARMNEVYFAQYERVEQTWQEMVTEQVCSPESAINQIQLKANTVVVGTGWTAYSQFAEAKLPLSISDITLPSAKSMLKLAELELEQGKALSALQIEPVYLRNEVTWEKLPHKR
ncbi:tRNA (adenosine(37)-N6)-threonylcarbamoyltransferase complex dimerization subunit type 1 TsaB [Actinobacillus pleuropneumoniae]|uniref:tRNA (adenosine(37)-N6)-threonylcarbamoyltransferase complex dimerization subunit type 1 TsaB n=1 Tax=Actinobacillus pleuropneumoniae TaxID=715 RepID=UPI001EED4543|nr:tRNA (adenosine(37)-N6)-threonylcarbamoyltransferase complex dimerization subunit type 1 TsaB [Actinobacillus pleuropneumoniae]UKH19705.1 tRNA (adenosine(37)-N6)-threonylcarbamoyltransferase complex dimerization subunit type 1 TsaB [Actinobacillus pleuropneumoniae]UPA21524.1 tRNA (adenosine(37)-N6)-threonylcarbamoyltransferase complex dimerization subunit type 1 TsaB [Actinobacillus pleuropneumoniae]